MSPELQKMLEAERKRSEAPPATLADEIGRERSRVVDEAAGSFNVTADTAPDDAGKIVSLADRYGMDYSLARDNREEIERSEKEETRRSILSSHPIVANFFRDPAKAAVGADSLEYYGQIAKQYEGRKPKRGLLEGAAIEVGDVGRSLGAGLTTVLAMPASGIGTAYEATIGNLVELNAKYGLGRLPGFRQAIEAEQRYYARNPDIGRAVDQYGSPGKALMAYGALGKDIAETYRPDSQGIEDKVAEGVGQILGAVVTAYASGGSALPTFLFGGMGADIQADRMRAQGIDPTSRPGTLAAGAAATGGLEAFRLNSILKILPASVRKKAFDSAFLRISRQAGEEAVQESAEAFTQNLIAMGYEPEANLFRGMVEEAGIAGASAAVFQSLVEVAIPGRQRASAAQSYVEQQQRVRQAVQEAPVFQRRKQDIEAFIEKAGEGETAFLDGEGLVQLYQADGTFGRIVREDLGLTDEDIERAYNGSDIEVPLSKIQTVRDQFEPILDIIRANPDAMSMREVREQAETDAMSVDMEALQRELADEQQALEGFERVQGAVTEQLVQAGRSPEEAEAAGVLWGAFFRRLSADGLDEGKVFDQLRLRIEGEQGKVKKPKEPQTLHSFVRSLGGIKESLGQDGRGYGRGDIEQATGKRIPGLINNKSGRTIDQIAELAREAGFRIEDDQQFIDMLAADLRGERVYPLNEGDQYRADMEAYDAAQVPPEEVLTQNEEVDLESLIEFAESQIADTPARGEGSLSEYPAAIPPEYEFSNFEDVGGKMVMMTPDQFLGLSSELSIDEDSRDTIAELAQMMLDGRNIDPPRLSVGESGVVDSHDGRHRALAAKQLGIQQVPVLLMGDGGGAFPSGVKKLRSQAGASDRNFTTLLEQAAAAGYQGQDRGEAQEWLAAQASGLDMSQEARMQRARDMGFDTDTVLYHGTKQGGFSQFRVGQGKTDGGIYLSDERATAESYSGDRKTIAPVTVLDVQENLDAYGLRIQTRGDQYEAVGEYAIGEGASEAAAIRDWMDQMADDPYGFGFRRGAGVYEVLVRAGAQLQIDADGSNWDSIESYTVDGSDQVFGSRYDAKQFQEENGLDGIVYINQQTTDDLAQEAAASGYDSLLIRNVIDDGGESDGGSSSNVTVIFDPSNIRSVNAAFDPDNADSANLLAQSAPLEVGVQTIQEGDASATVTVTGNGYAEMNMLRVPEESRRQGDAAALLDDLIAQADAQGLTLHLTPEAVGQGGMTDAQLRKFYASRGFLPNKGRNKDFAVRSSMIRPPTLNQPDGGAGSPPRATVQIPGVLTQLPGAQILKDEAVVVRLSKAADKTSFLHETAHIFLELYAALESENEAVAARMGDIRKWLKVEPGGKLTRDQHEKFAESFEVYLMEGKAPTKELRGVFRQFKAWFTSVYRRIRDRLPKLSPQAKSIFDRMLATEDDVAMARAETTLTLRQYMRDIMTEEQIARYEGFARRAGEVATERLFAKHVKEIRARDSKAYRTDKALIRAELMESFSEEGVYRAKAELTEDGKTIREDVDVDLIAPDYGFATGDALVEAVKKAPSLERTVDIETKRKMDALYGDMLTDGTAEEEAVEVVFNEQSVKTLEVERDALALKAAKQTIPLDQIKAYAQQQIDSLPVSQVIKPGRYAIKARDLHKRSLRSAARGKWEDALRYTHQAMLHHELARRAYKARDEFETIRRVLKPYRPSAFPKKDSHKKIDPPFVQAIRTLMALPGADGQFEGMSSLRAFRDKQAAEGIAVQLPMMVEADQPLPEIRNMTMDQLRDFRDSVKALGRQGRANSEEARAAFTVEVERIADVICANYTGKTKREVRNPTFMERRGKNWRDLEALFLRYPFLVEALQGGKDGLVVEALEQGLRRQLTLRNERRREMGEKLVDILDRHGITQKELRSTLSAPVIEAGAVRFEQVLALAMNMGTQSNRDRLASDPSLGSMDQLETLLTDKLEKRHWDAVQEMWDLIDTLWPEAKAVEQRVTGSTPRKVDAVPVDTRFGRYRGGYFPLSYDRNFLSNRDLEQQDMNDLWKQQVNGMATHAATEKGFLQARAENVSRPLNLSLDTMVEHIDNVTNDIYMREETINISRILRHPAFASAMADTHGKEYQRTLETVVKRVVHGSERADNSVDRFFRTMRVNASVAILGASVRTALLAPASYFQTVLPRYGHRVILDGMRAFYMRGFNAQKFITDKSAFMRERVDTLSREAHERVRNAKGESTINKIRGSGYWLMSFVEIWSTSGPTWMGVYRDALAKGKSEQDAITDADRAVATTQGSGLEIDQSILQGGSEFQRSLTFMWGYVSGYYGIVRNDIARAEGYNKAWPIVKHFLILNVVASMAEAFLRMTPEEDEDDPYLVAVKDVYWRNIIGMLPGVSLVANRYGSGEAPAIATGQDLVQSGRAWMRAADDLATTGELEGEVAYSATRQTLKSAGVALGVPGTLQIDKMVNTLVTDDDPTPYEVLMSGPDDDN